MKEIQYGTVTSVGKNSTYWAQVCTIKAHLTNKEYQNVEVITPKCLMYLPAIGDVVLFSEIHNSEVVIFWVLEQFDWSLSSWDIVLTRWTKYKIWAAEKMNIKSKVTLSKDFSITLETGDSSTGSFIPAASLKIKPNGTVEVLCNSFEII